MCDLGWGERTWGNESYCSESECHGTRYNAHQKSLTSAQILSSDFERGSTLLEQFWWTRFRTISRKSHAIRLDGFFTGLEVWVLFAQRSNDLLASTICDLLMCIELWRDSEVQIKNLYTVLLLYLSISNWVMKALFLLKKKMVPWLTKKFNLMFWWLFCDPGDDLGEYPGLRGSHRFKGRAAPPKLNI